MDSPLPSSGTTKPLSIWLDVFDHYVLAAMLAVSVGSFGLQTTQYQYQLICISSVKCSNVAENNTASVSGNG